MKHDFRAHGNPDKCLRGAPVFIILFIGEIIRRKNNFFIILFIDEIIRRRII